MTNMSPSIEALAQRLDSAMEAVKLLQARSDKMPTPDIVMAEVYKLEAVMNAKFDGNKTALDAALKTQKESSDKIEASFTKQLENVAKLVDTKTDGLDGKITDLKDRFLTSDSRNVGRELGVNDQRRDIRDSTQDTQWIWGVLVGVAIAGASIVASFLIK